VVFNILSLFIALIIGAILFIGRGIIAEYFTGEKDVENLTASVLQVVALNYQFFAWQFINCSIIQGIGKPQVSSLLLIFSSYLVALPTELLLGFFCGLGLFGLWLGMTLGYLLLGATTSYYIW
jgi:MATE family multidrug resistance protein